MYISKIWGWLLLPLEQTYNGDEGVTVAEGYNIGFPELYGEVRQLADKLAEYMSRHDLASNSQEHRLSEAIKDLEDMRTRMETEKLQRENLKRQYQMAMLTSFIFPIVVMVVGGLLISKGG